MPTRTKRGGSARRAKPNSQSLARPRCHFISNTHWDREWVYSMQRTRFHLVELMDLVLDLLSKEKRFQHFHLDSQTAPLLDYLEIRPEKEPVVRRLVRSGKLAVGPWFTLPDEYCISGESIVRNLLLGHAIARRFGRVSKTGYSPFSWGQCSQMPQIYKGFGIDMMMFYRGVNTLIAPRAEFIWRGADGTEIVASRLGRRPRYNAWYLLQRPAYWGYALDDVNRFEARWGDGHGAFRLASGTWATLDYQLAHPRYAYDQRVIPDAARRALREQDADWSTPHRFWSAGHDSSFPDAREVRLVADARAALRDEAEVFWSTVRAFQDGVLAARRPDWPVVMGEMRHHGTPGSTSPLIGAIISARTYLKQDNHASEQLLTRLAEPLAVFAALLGAPYPRTFLDRAYRYLLENHAHDSIGGCGRDIVAMDMLDRSRQCREIATCVLESALREIAGAIDFRAGTEARRHEGTKGRRGEGAEGRRGKGVEGRRGGGEKGRRGEGEEVRRRVGRGAATVDPGAVALVVFNPSPIARSEVVSVTLETPRDWPPGEIEVVEAERQPTSVDRGDSHQAAADAPAQLGADTQPHAGGAVGGPLVCQTVGAPTINEERVFNPHDVFNYLSMNRQEVLIAARDVPTMGYRAYWVRPATRPGVPAASLRHGESGMRNEFLEVTINANGTLSVRVRDLDWTLPEVGYLVDSGAAGNPWIHQPPSSDRRLDTLGERPRVSCVRDGTLECTYRVELNWHLPEGLSEDGRARSDRLVPVHVVSDVTLRAGQPWVEVVTELDNTVRDHHLRVTFPVPIDEVVHVAQTPLDVVRRPLDPPDPALHNEIVQDEQPFSGFVDLSARDGSRGVAILADGLRAYSLKRERGLAIELTLLRAYAMRFFVPEKLDHPELSAGSQCPGRHRFRYAICPHGGDWQAGRVWQFAERFTTPLVATQIAPTHHGSQPPVRSFLEVEPDTLHVSAVKQREDGRGWVVRLLNPSEQPVRGRLRLNSGFGPPRGDVSPRQRVKDEFALPTGPGRPWRHVQLVTLEERPVRKLKMTKDGWVGLELRPKEIATVSFEGANL